MSADLDPIVRTISLRCSLDKAFNIWTTRIHLWWPVARISASQDPRSRIVLEPRVGGRLYERADSGEEFVWGRVEVWEPPNRLVLSWFLNTDARRATEVNVRFSEQEDGTATVRVEHGKWEHADEAVAEEHHACVAAPEGWRGILSEFAMYLPKTLQGEQT